MDFVKDHKMSRLINILRTTLERIAFGRGSPTASSCLSKCARLGLNPEGPITANSLSPNLVRLQKK